MKILIVTVTVFAGVSGWAEEAAPASGASDAAPDLAGYRLCPKCNTLNAADATSCLRCGADLNLPATEQLTLPPAVISPFTLSVFGFVGTQRSWGGGARTRLDWLKASYAASYAYDAGWGNDWYSEETRHHRVGNDVRFHFGASALRPFLAVGLDVDYYYFPPDFYWWYHRDEIHSFVAFAGFGGGLEYNYDRRGSFFDVGGFAGPTASWVGGPVNDFQMRAQVSFVVGNVIYFVSHIGLETRFRMVTGAGDFNESFLALEVGPAFAF